MNNPFSNTLLQQKVALVSGGGSGIGYDIAKEILLCGGSVMITSRKEEKLIKAQQSLSEFGECFYQVCDIREPDAIESLAAAVKTQFGKLDILVNNAGGQFPSLAEDVSVKGWNAVVNNNLNGTWYMTQAMAKHFFIPQKSGTILNIIANIYRGFPGMVHTGAARAGVDNLTKTLAVEWSKYNIRINAVAPGIIRSTGLDQYPPEIIKGLEEQIPAKRLGTTREVAYLSLFLCSEASSYITGETVYIDGGQKLWGDVFKM